MQCGGSGMFISDPTFFHPGSRIPDPNCLHPGSRILIKEFKYFNPKKAKKWFLNSKKYYPGCSSRIPDPDADFLPSRIRMLNFSHPGSRIQGSKRHPIPDPDPQHCRNENSIYVFLFWELARPQSQFPHSCVCEQFIYSQDRST
jgi:hypothetical protein